MSQRLDITSRDLNRGQNDTAAAERLEFPGFVRSRNTRGRRETARRRPGYTRASDPGSISSGVGGIESANAANYVTIGSPGTGFHQMRQQGTIDLILHTISVTGTIYYVGHQGLGSYGQCTVYTVGTTLYVDLHTLAGNVSFTHTGLLLNRTYAIRIAKTEGLVSLFVGGAAAQTSTAANTSSWIGGGNPTYLLHDYTEAGAVESRNLTLFRMMNIGMHHRGGMMSIHPRPRDKHVVLELYTDSGTGLLSYGVTNFVQDHSSYQKHAIIVGAIGTHSPDHIPLVQWFGEADNPEEAENRFPLIIDGDVAMGRLT